MATYGSKRLVTGARYGLRDWLAQRVTAALMALFTFALLAQVLMAGEMDYVRWSGIFAAQWMKVVTFALILALAYHAWVGMRDIWMDYVKPMGLRLVLHVFTLVWLVGCTGWADSSALEALKPWFPQESSTSSSWVRAAPACAPRCNWPVPG